MKNNFPQMHMYMKKFSRKTVKEGTMAVKSGALGRDTVLVVYINTIKTTLHFNFDFNHSLKQSIAIEFGRTTVAVNISIK